MFHKFILDSSEENEDDYDMNFIDPSYNENKLVKNDSINEPKSHYDHSSNRKFDYGYKNQKYHNHNYSNPKFGYKQEQNYKRNRGSPLSPQDQYRKKIAEENHKIVLKHPELIDFDGVKTIGIYHHFNIPDNINRKCPIRVFDCSTIEAAIQCHDAHPQNKICILNFANSVRPGGGYLNGRNAQEECLCRQTLLYPTIQKSYMYYENKQKGSKPEASDIMIYSPNVLVIRNDDYKMIHPFRVDIISAAVDNRGGNIYNIEEIMMNRIRKIIKIAAEEKVEVLILGAFGCGVFKNDTKTVSELFAKVLLDEGLKDYFNLIVFPIYKGSPHTMQIFQTALKPAGKKL